MLLAVLLQSAAAAGLGKLGAALGAAIAVIGAGIGICLLYTSDAADEL